MSRSDDRIGNIDIHIERLVLDGIDVPRRQRPGLKAAVEAELTRLMTADGLASSLSRAGTTPRMQVGSIQLIDVADSAHMGRQIAQAVYGGIN